MQIEIASLDDTTRKNPVTLGKLGIFGSKTFMFNKKNSTILYA